MLDFSENFMQGESQGFHWENSQCTVHPLVIYNEKANDNEITHKNFYFLSPSTKHNASVVYTFISALMSKIKCFIPELSKIYYCSDGCAGQYKKKFHFINLCYHKMDFDVECKWHFFATFHGKSACDEIEGVVKMTAKAKLQRPFENQILTSQNMYTFCIENFGEKLSFFVLLVEKKIFGNQIPKCPINSWNLKIA